MPPRAKIKGKQTLRPRTGDDVALAFNRKLENAASLPFKVAAGVQQMVEEGSQNVRDALPSQVSDQDNKLNYPRQRRSKENEAYLKSFQSRQRLQKAQANREKAEKAIDADEQIIRGIDKNQRDDLVGISEAASALSSVRRFKRKGNSEPTKVQTPRKANTGTSVLNSKQKPAYNSNRRPDPPPLISYEKRKAYELADKEREKERLARVKSFGLDPSARPDLDESSAKNALEEWSKPGGYDYTDARKGRDSKSSVIRSKASDEWKALKGDKTIAETRRMGKKTDKMNVRAAKNEEHNRKARAKLKERLKK